jgi:hypothetical protein
MRREALSEDRPDLGFHRAAMPRRLHAKARVRLLVEAPDGQRCHVCLLAS